MNTHLTEFGKISIRNILTNITKVLKDEKFRWEKMEMQNPLGMFATLIDWIDDRIIDLKDAHATMKDTERADYTLRKPWLDSWLVILAALVCMLWHRLPIRKEG